MKDDLLNSLKDLLVESMAQSGQDLSLDMTTDHTVIDHNLQTSTIKSPSAASFRVFNEDELERFTPEARELLQHLVEIRLIDTGMREQLIDRLFESQAFPIRVEEVKWGLLSILNEGSLSENKIHFLEFVLSEDASDESD